MAYFFVIPITERLNECASGYAGQMGGGKPEKDRRGRGGKGDNSGSRKKIYNLHADVVCSEIDAETLLKAGFFRLRQAVRRWCGDHVATWSLSLLGKDGTRERAKARNGVRSLTRETHQTGRNGTSIRKVAALLPRSPVPCL